MSQHQDQHGPADPYQQGITVMQRLWGEPIKLPELAVLRPGTLDDTSWLHPIAHIWTRSAQPWIRIPADALNFSGQPQGDEVAALLRAWKERTAN